MTAREGGEWPHDGTLISELGEMNILASSLFPSSPRSLSGLGNHSASRQAPPKGDESLGPQDH